MFERLFERDTRGVIKGLTLEWRCPDCNGLNFRILTRAERASGLYHAQCRYCHAKFRVAFDPPARPVEGETDFYDMLEVEEFTSEDRNEMVRDFAEIASLKADSAAASMIQEKEKALEIKIDAARRRRR